MFYGESTNPGGITQKKRPPISRLVLCGTPAPQHNTAAALHLIYFSRFYTKDSSRLRSPGTSNQFIIG